MITRTFKLCLNAGTGSAPFINVSQTDRDEVWLFELYSETGERYIPSSGAIIGIKADGYGIANTGTVDSEGRVVITETQQMTAAAGRAIFELSIDGLTHGTANFIVNVEKKPIDGAIMSDSDLSLIQQAVDAASEIETLLDGQDVPTVITPIITDWLDENITNPSNPPIDTSLTVAGAAADAKVVGDDISELKSAFNNLTNINDVTFEWGNIYNGNINTDQNRIHSVDLMWLPKGTKIVSNATYNNFGVCEWNLDGTYKANGTWGRSYETQDDCYARIVLRKSSGNIGADEFSSLISTLSIYYPLQAISDKAYDGYKKASELKSVQNAYGIIDTVNSDNIALSNLFDKNASGNTTTGYYDRTNTFVTNGSIRTSDYIRVFEGLEYYTNLAAGGYALWFDENKTFIGYTDVAQGARFKPKANAVYLRAMYLEASKDSFTVLCDEIYKVASASSVYASKNGVAFGTSLTYRAQSTGGYLQFLPALSGANIENKGLGNSTILDNGSNPKMMDVITGYTGYASKDFAILEGFVNDWYNNSASLGTWKDTGTTTVCGCVRAAITYILTQNPSITLILVIDPIGKSESGVDCSSLAVRNGITQSEFYDEIAKVADNLGIPTIRVDRNSGMSELTPYMYIDNIHPNAEGAEQTANTIWSAMKNIPIKVVDA